MSYARPLPTAENISELYKLFLQVREHLNSMTPEWWNRDVFKPLPSDGTGGMVVINPAGEANWCRGQAANEYRDNLRIQAMRLWQPGMTIPPPQDRSAERDIFDVLMPWLMSVMNNKTVAGDVPAQKQENQNAISSQDAAEMRQAIQTLGEIADKLEEDGGRVFPVTRRKILALMGYEKSEDEERRLGILLRRFNELSRQKIDSDERHRLEQVCKMMGAFMGAGNAIVRQSPDEIKQLRVYIEKLAEQYASPMAAIAESTEPIDELIERIASSAPDPLQLDWDGMAKLSAYLKTHRPRQSFSVMQQAQRGNSAAKARLVREETLWASLRCTLKYSELRAAQKTKGAQAGCIQDILAKITAQAPDPVRLTDDEFDKLLAYLESHPRVRMSLAQMSMVAKGGTPPKEQRDWIAWAATREYNQRLRGAGETTSEGKPDQSALPDQPEPLKSNKGGRPAISREDAAKRRKLKEDWNRARESGVSFKDFCADQKLNPKHAQKWLNWVAKQAE